jgi:phage terminase Nu1 subunit (DNA packaging protein)
VFPKSKFYNYSDAQMGIKLNRTGIADHMGVSLPTIDRWVREACPVDQRGSRGVEWIFDLADVIRWYTDKKIKEVSSDDPTEESQIERRTLTAKMRSAELALAKEMGEVAPVHEFEQAQAAIFSGIRANCLNIPQRVASQLVGETDQLKIKTLLRHEITLALEAAANAQLKMPDDDEE